MRGAALILALAGLGAAPPAAGEDKIVFQEVTVRRGETLWAVANTYLKDPAQWDQILKHNKLPSSDPTVALPGMILRIPVRFIKEELRAASLVLKVNQVTVRRRDTVKWEPASEKMQLFRDDTLRTLGDSRARVQFMSRDLLGLNPDSMAVIKPAGKDYDVDLREGGVYAGNSIVQTPAARVVPKGEGTRFTATVRRDRSTVVEVYSGHAAVKGSGAAIDVKAGMATEVKLGMAPAAPVNIPDLPDFEERSAKYEAGLRAVLAPAASAPKAQVSKEVSDAAAHALGEISLKTGDAVSAYRLQLSRDPDFLNTLVDRSYDPGDRISVSDLKLPPGNYWGRVAVVDLLGSQGRFSGPRLYRIDR